MKKDGCKELKGVLHPACSRGSTDDSQTPPQKKSDGKKGGCTLLKGVTLGMESLHKHSTGEEIQGKTK